MPVFSWGDLLPAATVGFSVGLGIELLFVSYRLLVRGPSTVLESL